MQLMIDEPDYGEMANDREREREVLEWCEALIADAYVIEDEGSRRD